MTRVASLVAFAAALPVSAQVTLNQYPLREYGQNQLPSFGTPPTSVQPNLVDGRGLNDPTGIAFDYSVNPPRVWVVDSGNNRVLGWNNSTGLSKGNPADIILGQHDAYSDLAGGPGTNVTVGLNAPGSVAVDAAGNVYVADIGNNRILRYPNASGNPISTGENPDMVIGQTSFGSGRSPNQGLNAPTNKTLSLSPFGGCCLMAIAFDSQGDLWVADPGNNRALRFPASGLAAGTSGLAADTVIGQSDFVSNANPTAVNGDIQLSQTLERPGGIGFDGAGRLYVADALDRVVEYQPNPNTGQTYDRVLGHPPAPQQNQQITYPSQYTLGLVANGAILGPPRGIFAVGNNVFVCDTPNNRVVFYDVYSNWSAPTTANPSPLEFGVLGQTGFGSGSANQGLSIPNGGTLSAPVAGALNTANNDLWIVDSGNNRVIAIPANGGGLSGQTYSAGASRVLGQLDVYYSSPNLVEGKEVWLATSFNSGITGGGGVVVDSLSNPPNVYTYIADTQNNRVLGFKNGRSIGTDSRNPLAQTADLVIGQAGVDYAVRNYSGNFATSGVGANPSATGLSFPMGLALDKKGNLYVADLGNSRVVRFPAPFAQPAGSQPTANLVLGQPSLTSPPITDPSQNTMSAPYGLAIFADGKLAVSDTLHNRILIFSPGGADFSNGQNASSVVGQPNFFSIGAGVTSSALNSPRHIAVDSSDRLYVADAANGRMAVFPNTIKSTNGVAAVLEVGGINAPVGIAVSQNTGESWISSANSNAVYRFPEFKTLQSSLQNDYAVPANGPLALALDANEDLIVAEGINRVAFFFPAIYFKNSASYAAGSPGSPSNVAPGMLMNLGRYRTALPVTQTNGFAPVPYQTTLNDIQVLVNGVKAPIYYLLQSIGWVYIQVPMSTPESGNADFLVEQASTGQILGGSTFTMQAAAPGIFTTNNQGTGQVSANNLDSKGNYLGNNSPSSAVSASGGIIVLYLTGQGKVNNPPPDGQAPGNAGSTTPSTPIVYIGGQQAQVLFSGLSPQFPGLWQIDAVVPPGTFPTGALPVFVQLGDYTSTIGGTNSTAPGAATGEPGPDIQLDVNPNHNITTMATK